MPGYALNLPQLVANRGGNDLSAVLFQLCDVGAYPYIGMNNRKGDKTVWL